MIDLDPDNGTEYLSRDLLALFGSTIGAADGDGIDDLLVLSEIMVTPTMAQTGTLAIQLVRLLTKKVQ